MSRLEFMQIILPITSAKIAECENEVFWSGLFEDLKERMCGSDDHPVYMGIQKATEAAFLGASWQLCQIPRTRAALKNIPKNEQKEVSENLKEAL